MLPRAFLTPRRGITAALLALLITSCESPAGLGLEDGSVLHRSSRAPTAQEELLKEVRRATSRFHSSQQAAIAGYEETDHCVPRMGFNRINPSLVDPAFDPERPEVLLYAPGPNAQPKLFAVEYIVINRGQTRPSFAGYPFDVGGTPLGVPHWSPHVWLCEENPNGIFTAWNPEISCS